MIGAMERTGSEDTQWLTPEEMRTWRAFVQLTVALMAEMDEALLDAHGLTEGEIGRAHV